MINALNGRYRKHIAWIMFLLFYGELAGSLYAAKNRTSRFIPSYASNYVSDIPSGKAASSFYTPAVPSAAVEFVKEAAAVSGAAENQSAGGDQQFIDGPGQPEMSSFRSVGADNMVNLFTGDFSYNIPLLDVGGYPVNLFYNAGISMDQEASWVGLGWNLNPGTVSRNMRGLPDDFNEVDTVTNTQSMKSDLTIGVTASKSKEIFGNVSVGSSINLGIFYNNRRGLGLEAGVSGELTAHKMLSFKSKDEMTFKDTTKKNFSISGGVNLNSQNGMGLSGGFAVYNFDKKHLSEVGLSTGIDWHSRQGVTDMQIGGEFNRYKENNKNIDMKSNVPLRGSISFARSSFVPSIRVPITRVNQLYTLKLGPAKWANFANVNVSGYINESRIAKDDRVQKKPAYGYMYYEEGKDNKDALLDFNRVNDGVYTLKRPVISLPVYTYDVFTINGEGTGGSFRGYRGNIGNIRDNETKDKTSALNLAVELGAGKLFHGGTMIGGVYSPSFVNEWTTGNTLRKSIAFKGNDSIYQGFYFKNPGEKAIIDEAYYNNVGKDQLIRPYLLSTSNATPILGAGYQVFDKDRKVESVTAANKMYRAARDKRTQVITYLTAGEATEVGLDQAIYSYKENSFRPGDCGEDSVKTKIPRYDPYDPVFHRKKHHISEVDVLEPDGRRYVYGIPVYQLKQKEATFSTDQLPAAGSQLVTYAQGENTVDNKAGRDGSFQSQELGSYAHSFLLTGILSPDYVDVTGNGISDDDLGTAVKFNYSRIDKKSAPKGNYWNAYKWRMPFELNSANFNEGLKSDREDNKALYTYGEKEIWYLHSIESKNMVATFRTSDRADGKQVVGEQGGRSTNPLDASQKKLDRIDLYTKADFLAKGINAKPIKTVHFQYSYKLCPNYPLNENFGQSTNTGKLTLEAVWFSYNGNQKQKNKYQFKYGTGDRNPSYNSSEADRWGSYKASSTNPGGLSNGDHPYTSQDTVLSNKYAAAWNLHKILLPSGGTMEVGYEADDYAFVQDKRAALMTQMLGFGFTANGTIAPTLYSTGNGGQMKDPAQCDNRFVFFASNTNLTSKNEVYDKYLHGFKQLLLKVWVEMPRGNIGSVPAYEPVMVYASIKDYGVIERPDNKDYFYVELAPTDRGGSPVVETVLQFLKEQLPQRAYPGYDVSDKSGLMQFVSAVWGMLSNLVQGVMGFEQAMKLSGSCKKVDLNRSGVRLTSADLKKIGGGHRVKSIIIGDSWSKLTTRSGTEQGMPDSYYGQLYNYSKTEIVNGVPVVASSGVASYEPGIGNEENPFREVLKYSEKQFLGPTDHSNVELPLAETFFPSPMVGYAKVSVKSIHSKENKKIKSGVGLQETEYFTTRDFPVIADFTNFDVQSRKHHSPPFLNQILNLDKKDYITLTQGFRVILNDMNGKIKSQTSYPETDHKTIINSTRYYYRTVEVGNNKHKLDNLLPVISGPDGVITTKLIGKEVEVMNDFREHFSYTYSKQIPLNIDVFGFPPFMAFVPTFFRMGFRDESLYRSATTLKVVNEYGILDSVVNNDKGSIVATKNLVYDAETGDVLLTRTYNEFKKPVYQFNYPAWWAESGMEPAYRNIDLVYKGVVFRNGLIESAHVNTAHFESGDELYVEHTDNKELDESVGCIIGGYPATIPLSTEKRIWAIYTGKDVANTTDEQKRFIFLDRYGNPYTSSSANLRIIRSGKRNLTGTSVGSIVSLKDPRSTNSGITRIDIKDEKDVLSASAMKFKEKWRGTQMFYTKTEDLMTVRRTVLHSTILNPVQSYTAQLKRRYDNRNDVQYLYNVNREFGVQKQRVYEGSRYLYDINSWMRFNISSMTQLDGVTVKSARLKLLGHKEEHRLPVNQTLNIHSANRPHQNNGNETPMDIKFTRMLTPWYADNDNSSWRRIFQDNPNDEYQNGVSRFNPMISQVGETTRDYTVDVTDIARGMIANRTNSAIAAGIKMSFQVPSEQISWDRDDSRKWRLCFRLFDSPGWESGYTGSYMELDYYKCQSSDPIIYQGSVDSMPVTPPPGYVYCNSIERVTRCLSSYNKKQMNPYILGVLGNWRPQESYVFYGERRESDFTVETDISKDGVMKDFAPFWVMQNDGNKMQGVVGTKWVWNSTITQYNRKGAELENHDALYRYNAGIYGYQETLPIAVVNNSRLRLSAFDGFEDYHYQDNPCAPFCNPFHRHFNTGISTAALDTNFAHTGRYSWKIPKNTVRDIPLQVTEDDTTSTPRIRIDVKKTPYEIQSVTPRGTGWKVRYFRDETFTTPVVTAIVPEVSLQFTGVSDSKGLGCVANGHGNLPWTDRCNRLTVKWNGYLQVPVTGNYQFDGRVDDNVWMTIDGIDAYEQERTGPKTAPVLHLTAGDMHVVEVWYYQHSAAGFVDLFWKQPNSNGVLAPNAPFTRIPSVNVYPEGYAPADSAGSVKTTTVYCEKIDSVQAVKHQLIDSLNLIPGKKMVASVWVKKDSIPCQCATYSGLNMYVKKANGTIIGNFVAKERVIEGWQQFEAVFDVPLETTNLKMEFSASGGVPLYIDDIRLHPFNANMKSFVYDKLTLRLAAELDENNFATFYEYDDEGTPARVKKETRQGIKTISETRSALQKKEIEL